MKDLSQRVTEIEWYAYQNKLLIEPHLYPKGLFRSQLEPANRFKLSAYIAELREDLVKFESLGSALQQSMQAKKLLQKISVLINGFRSQVLRKPKVSNVESLLSNINPETGDAFQYLMKQQQAPDKSALKQRLSKYQQDLAALQHSYQAQQHKLRQCTGKEQDNLKNNVLSLGQQIGLLEQRITKLKELL